MEAIVLNMDQYLKSNAENSKGKISERSKDFNSTLESMVNKSTKNNKNSKSIRANEISSSNESTKEAKLKENSDLECKDEKIENQEIENQNNSTIYGNILYLLNNTNNVKEFEFINDIKNAENNTFILDTINLSKETVSENFKIEDSLDESEKIVIDSTLLKDIIKNQTNEENNNKSVNEIKYMLNENSKDTQMIFNTEIKKINTSGLEDENFIDINEDILLDSELNILNIEELSEQEDFNEFSQNNKMKSFTSDQELEDLEIDQEFKEFKIHDESFHNMEKNSIRFIDNSYLEIDQENIVDSKEVIKQIVDKFKIDTSQNKNEITLKLKPEILGEMTMSIEVVKDTVIAKLMVENQKTKEIIEGNLIQLKEEIKDSGMEIKTFEVFVGNGSDFDKHNSSQFNLKQNSKKIRIKSQSNKTLKNYEENSLESKVDSIGLYSENGLNIFA